MSSSDPGYQRLRALAAAIGDAELPDHAARERLRSAAGIPEWDHAQVDALVATLRAAGLVEALPGGRWRRNPNPPTPPSPVEAPGRWASHVQQAEKALLAAELKARRAAAEALAQPVRDARRAEVLALLIGPGGRLVEPLAEAVRREVQAALEAERAGDTATTLEVSHA